VLYGVPYAYAATTSSSYQVNVTYGAPANTQDFQGGALCNSGDYVTGGGFTIQFTDLKVVRSYPGGDGNPPTGWFVSVDNLSGQSPNFTVWAVCQTPITVAGIGVPEFGSLYLAIALGAVVYFMLSRQFTRRPTISTKV
jgi:hypothetical protein